MSCEARRTVTIPQKTMLESGKGVELQSAEAVLGKSLLRNMHLISGTLMWPWQRQPKRIRSDQQKRKSAPAQGKQAGV